MTHRQRICSVHSDDVIFLQQFNDQLQMLTAMVKEMLVEEPKLLLSPVMRKALANKAAEVESLHAPLRQYLVADNPGQPFKPWEAS